MSSHGTGLRFSARHPANSHQNSQVQKAHSGFTAAPASPLAPGPSSSCHTFQAQVLVPGERTTQPPAYRGHIDRLFPPETRGTQRAKGTTKCPFIPRPPPALVPTTGLPGTGLGEPGDGG